jgi:hypothetical protein
MRGKMQMFNRYFLHTVIHGLPSLSDISFFLVSLLKTYYTVFSHLALSTYTISKLLF